MIKIVLITILLSSSACEKESKLDTIRDAYEPDTNAVILNEKAIDIISEVSIYNNDSLNKNILYKKFIFWKIDQILP